MEHKELIEKLKTIIEQEDETLIYELVDRYADEKYKELIGLRELIDDEMSKPEGESDLLIIGEKVVGYLGYWG